jgi:hypothetical protein
VLEVLTHSGPVIVDGVNIQKKHTQADSNESARVALWTSLDRLMLLTLLWSAPVAISPTKCEHASGQLMGNWTSMQALRETINKY